MQAMRQKHLCNTEGEAGMTDERFLILSACIWLAPHVPKGIAIANGCVMLLLVAAIGLEWLP
jgi:hypothetical protein